MIRNPERSSVI